MRKGYLTLEERQKLAKGVSGALSTIGEVEGIRQDVVETLTNAGTAAALVVATAATGGAAAPLTLSTAAELGASGAAARVALKGSLEGSNYTVKAAVQDAAIGAAQGATSSVGAGVGGKLAGAFTRGAIQGGLGGAVGGGADTAVRADTWKGGVVSGAAKTLKSAASGAAAGALTGGVLGGVLRPRNPLTLASEETRLREAKEALAHKLVGDASRDSRGKISPGAARDFLDAYSKARALPESGKIPQPQLGLFSVDAAAAGKLFNRAEAYFDLNQQHIQAARRLSAYGGSTRVLDTFDATRAPKGVEGFAETFSNPYVEEAYAQAGRPKLPTADARIADRQAWYRDAYLGPSAESSVGWRQSKPFVKGTYEEWQATQQHLMENGLHFLKGTFHDGAAFELAAGSEVRFERLGRQSDLGQDVRSIFLGADQGQGAVEAKNAIDPSFTGGGAYTHQAEYAFKVPPGADWVFLRGRIQGTTAVRRSASGSLSPDVGGAEQLVIWDRTARAPVSLAKAGVTVERTRVDPIARPED